MAAHHPHPLGLDGQSRLGGLLLGDNHHRAQVDYPSAVRGTELMIINNPRQDEEKPQNVALMKKKNWTGCHLPVGPRTSYPPGRVFTDEQAVAGTSHIFLP